MSVKFEKETTRTTSGGPPPPPPQAPPGGQFGPRDMPKDMPKGKEDFAHEVGNALTRAGGPNGYLAVSSFTSAMLGSIINA